MKQRSISAIGVVIVGLVPAFMGGPVWAIVLGLLCLIGLHEYQSLAVKITPKPIPVGYAVVPLMGAIAYMKLHEAALLGVIALAVGAPFIMVILRPALDGAFSDWALSAGGALYLGIPLFAAVETRQISGTVDRQWIHDLAHWASPGWSDAPRGLAWLLLVILVTWLSDTGAYLVGRSFGKHPLIPVVSPKKTVEGLIGGFVACAITAVIANEVFGLGIPVWLALLAGVTLGIVGVFGDLAESVLKRQAKVKDSGTLIPGHGGMLDRLDALLFTWTVGWFLAIAIDSVL